MPKDLSHMELTAISTELSSKIRKTIVDCIKSQDPKLSQNEQELITVVAAGDLVHTLARVFAADHQQGRLELLKTILETAFHTGMENGHKEFVAAQHNTQAKVDDLIQSIKDVLGISQEQFDAMQKELDDIINPRCPESHKLH